METKIAESHLSAEESNMWEAMKSEYMSSHGLEESKAPTDAPSGDP